MATLGVIPARKGSKRFPGKNRSLFRGKSLVTWAVEQGLASDLDMVVISTDDPEILEPVEIIDRPEHLATDTATSEDVLRHALSLYPHDSVMLLQPTSPLRTAWDINQALRLFHVEHQTVISYRPDGTKNGAIYVCSAEWLKNHTFKDEHIRYWMPKERSLDIDYPEDVELSCHC